MSKRQWRRTASPRAFARIGLRRRGNLRGERSDGGYVKRFFAENGKRWLSGVILSWRAGGWRYWAAIRRSPRVCCFSGVSKYGDGGSADKPDNIPAAEKFAAENKNTYGALASWNWRSGLLNKNEQKAEADLQRGLAATSDENLKAVINLRLARVRLAEAEADAALKTLDAVEAKDGRPLSLICAAKRCWAGSDKKARCNTGVNSDFYPGVEEMMRMKINNLCHLRGTRYST